MFKAREERILASIDPKTGKVIIYSRDIKDFIISTTEKYIETFPSQKEYVLSHYHITIKSGKEPEFKYVNRGV